MAQTDKQLLGAAIAARVTDGDILGLGSGTTAEAVLDAIGERIRMEKLSVRGVATSHRSAQVAQRVGIQVLHPASDEPVSWAFDGADEIDPAFNLIKGRGGAMLLEKVVAKRAGGIIVIATEEKLVKRLGEKFPIPVEVVPEALPDVERALKKLGATELVPRTSSAKYGPTVTEKGNFILDIRFASIDAALESTLKSIVGVVESGLFIDLVKEVHIARQGKVERLK